MHKAFENILTRTENTTVNLLYRFADNFFDDTRDKKDLMDNPSVKFIITNTGIVYLAARRVSEKWLPVFYDYSSELIQKAFNWTVKTLLMFYDKMNREKEIIEFFPPADSNEIEYRYRSIIVNLEKFANWLFEIPEKKIANKERETKNSGSLFSNLHPIIVNKFVAIWNRFRFENLLDWQITKELSSS